MPDMDMYEERLTQACEELLETLLASDFDTIQKNEPDSPDLERIIELRSAVDAFRAAPRPDGQAAYHCPACGKDNTPSDSTMRRAREHVEG